MGYSIKQFRSVEDRDNHVRQVLKKLSPKADRYEDAQEAIESWLDDMITGSPVPNPDRIIKKKETQDALLRIEKRLEKLAELIAAFDEMRFANDQLVIGRFWEASLAGQLPSLEQIAGWRHNIKQLTKPLAPKPPPCVTRPVAKLAARLAPCSTKKLTKKELAEFGSTLIGVPAAANVIRKYLTEEKPG